MKTFLRINVPDSSGSARKSMSAETVLNEPEQNAHRCSIIVLLLLIGTLILTVSPNNVRGQNLSEFTKSAVSHLRNGDYASAISQSTLAIERDPNDALAWCTLGLARGQLKQWDLAADALRKGLSINPKPHWDATIEKVVRDALAEADRNAKIGRSSASQSLTRPPDPNSMRMYAETGPGLESLPKEYVGAVPKETVARLKKLLDNIPVRIDSYSTLAEKERFNQIAVQQVEALGRLAFVYSCYKNYDANAQVFKFSITPDRSRWNLHKVFGVSDSAAVTIAEESTTLGSYEASNAFGVKRQVARIRRAEIALAYRSPYLDRNKQGDEPQSLITGRFSSSYEFSIPLSSDEARASDKNIRCLIWFSPRPPYLTEYEDHVSPTINVPIETDVRVTAIVGRFDELWIFNQLTGKVYAKFK